MRDILKIVLEKRRIREGRGREYGLAREDDPGRSTGYMNDMIKSSQGRGGRGRVGPFVEYGLARDDYSGQSTE